MASVLWLLNAQAKNPCIKTSTIKSQTKKIPIQHEHVFWRKLEWDAPLLSSKTDQAIRL